MTRPSFRLPVSEFLTVLGLLLGVWLINSTFQHGIDTPNYILLFIGVLDILLCFAIFSQMLRKELRKSDGLPRGYIIGAAVLLASFLGWNFAVLLDADRLRAEQVELREHDQQLVKLEESLRHFVGVVPALNGAGDRNAWQINYDNYARLNDQLKASFRERAAWDKELSRINDQVGMMHKSFNLLLGQPTLDQRIKWRDDFLQARERADQQVDALRAELGTTLRDLDRLYRARWHSVAASALVGVALLLGGVLLWLLFDRELRRSSIKLAEVTQSEARFRSMAEYHSNAVAVLDRAGIIQYGNGVWSSAFNYDQDELLGRPLLELIHDEDRARVQRVLETDTVEPPLACRLSTDYGVWHDVELVCHDRDGVNAYVVELRNLRQSHDVPMPTHDAKQSEPMTLEHLPTLAYLVDPTTKQFASVNNLPATVFGSSADGKQAVERFQAALHPDDVALFTSLPTRCTNGSSTDEFRLRDADGQEQWFQAHHRLMPKQQDGSQLIVGVAFPIDTRKSSERRIVELERELAKVRDRESVAQDQLRRNSWLLNTHQQANSEGLLVLSRRGEALSWNPAFVRLWKLSEEILTGHTWETISAHMESQVETGWYDFRRTAQGRGSSDADSTWEMQLEGGRVLEVYAQALRDADHPSGALQFHFRDVTNHRDLETKLRDHQDQSRSWQKRADDYETEKSTWETSQCEAEKKHKQLERQLREHERKHAEFEAALRDRNNDRDELEASLRDHQERLHQFHREHEADSATLQAGKQTARRLATGVAHEINGILSVVLGNTEVLRENLPKDHMAQNYVSEIRGAAGRGAELTQSLLGFSRNHLMQMKPLDINEHLIGIEDKLRDALGYNVQLSLEPASESLWVKTDIDPMEQAILNLVASQRHNLPTGGGVIIETERVNLDRDQLTHSDMAPGYYVRIRLTDTGKAMEDDVRANVFEPYHSLCEGHKGDLSLATAYGTIRQNGGCVEIERDPNNGNSWSLLLPETRERPQNDAQPLRASA
ncbi:MAG: PAS domain S-box protein [Gemmataceae bacterium]|nr:PAS domain S-box protein [Gemmataceae bacterium]